MDLARKKLTANRKVSIHNRSKILEFLDYLETQEISLPRRTRYLQNMSKLAAILQVDFEEATKSQIESVILKHGRLDLAFLYWLQSLGAITVTVNYNALSAIGTNAIAWGSTEFGGGT